MEQLAVNELTTYRWSFEQDVHAYQQAGFQGISVWRHKLSDFGNDKGVELITEAGLEVACLLWAGGFTGSDGRSYRDSVADAVEAIGLASELKASCLSVYSGARAGHTHNHARRLLNSALEELLPLAAEHGVTLAIEPVHPGCAQEWTFLTDFREACQLVQRFDSPYLKVSFDTYYFGWDETLRQQLEQFVPLLACVHLGDGRQEPDGEQDRCALGAGNIPLAEIIGSLRRGGYDGFYDLKLMGQDIEAADYLELLNTCSTRFRQWCQDADSP